jgi:hypothetical protein
VGGGAIVVQGEVPNSNYQRCSNVRMFECSSAVQEVLGSILTETHQFRVLYAERGCRFVGVSGQAPTLSFGKLLLPTRCLTHKQTTEGNHFDLTNVKFVLSNLRQQYWLLIGRSERR